jgi:hypothetical protein
LPLADLGPVWAKVSLTSGEIHASFASRSGWDEPSAYLMDCRCRGVFANICFGLRRGSAQGSWRPSGLVESAQRRERERTNLFTPAPRRPSSSIPRRAGHTARNPVGVSQIVRAVSL